MRIKECKYAAQNSKQYFSQTKGFLAFGALLNETWIALIDEQAELNGRNSKQMEVANISMRDSDTNTMGGMKERKKC